MTSAVLSNTPDGSKTPKFSARSLQPFAWPLGFVVVIALLFVFYHNLVPNLSVGANKHINDWLPISSVNEAMVWISMALGLNVVVGYAGLLDLGYVAFWAIGGYVAAWLMAAPWDHGLNFSFGAPPGVTKLGGAHITFWLVLIISGLLCVIGGVIIGAPTLRLRGDYLALVTMGFGEMVRQLAQNGKVGGFNLTNGDAGIPSVDPIGTGPLHILPGVPRKLGPFDSSFKLIVLALIVAACLFISLRIRGGRLGRAWLAIREDELAASMMGVSLVKAKLSAYAVGAFFGGLGGVAYASGITGAVSPSKFDFSISITVLLMVVLGGMGNVWGVMIGAFILSWVNSTGLNQIGITWDNITGRNDVQNFKANQFGLFGIVLVLMMLFRREGIIPERRTKALMKEPSRELADHLGADVTAAEMETEFIETPAAEEATK